MFDRVIYIFTFPICFWSLLSYVSYIVLKFEDPSILGITFYTSYLSFFPVLLLCIIGCGSSIIIGLGSLYQKNKQYELI